MIPLPVWARSGRGHSNDCRWRSGRRDCFASGAGGGGGGGRSRSDSIRESLVLQYLQLGRTGAASAGRSAWTFGPQAVVVERDGRRSEFDGFGMTLAKVQESVKELSARDRAELLDWLWDGLQPERVLQIQERWAAEAEERIDAVDRGELPTVSS